MSIIVVVVYLLSCVQLFVTPQTRVCHTLLSYTASLNFVKNVGSFDDTVQPSHPLSSPSPLALTLSQHQGHFQGVFSSHEMAKVLDLSFQ